MTIPNIDIALTDQPQNPASDNVNIQLTGDGWTDLKINSETIPVSNNHNSVPFDIFSGVYFSATVKMFYFDPTMPSNVLFLDSDQINFTAFCVISYRRSPSDWNGAVELNGFVSATDNVKIDYQQKEKTIPNGTSPYVNFSQGTGLNGVFRLHC